MITIEELNNLGFHKIGHQYDNRPRKTYQSLNYHFNSEKGSISINHRRDTLRLGGCTGGRAFLIHLRSASHLQVILDALFDEDIVYNTSNAGIIGGRQ